MIILLLLLLLLLQLLSCISVHTTYLSTLYASSFPLQMGLGEAGRGGLPAGGLGALQLLAHDADDVLVVARVVAPLQLEGLLRTHAIVTVVDTSLMMMIMVMMMMMMMMMLIH
jgi:hypothetical protein